MKLTRSTSNAQRPTLNSQQSVDLHIEELVLDGFAHGERYAIGEAVERELSLLLLEQGTPASLQSDNATDQLRGETFNPPRVMTSSVVGRQIASAVYRAIGQ